MRNSHEMEMRALPLPSLQGVQGNPRYLVIVIFSFQINKRIGCIYITARV